LKIGYCFEFRPGAPGPNFIFPHWGAKVLSLLINKKKLLGDKDELGRWGENRCEKFLKAKGLRTLAKNYSCKTGELDLVMVDTEGSIVFVEVKTRADEAFAPTESVVTRPKKTRLTRTARHFLCANNIRNRPCRFDVVTIVLPKSGTEQIKHYPNAFTP